MRFEIFGFFVLWLIYNNSLTVNSSNFDHEIVEGPNTYYINSLQLTKYQAQSACRARKMTLITIEEKQNVQRIIPKYYDLVYWTSNVTGKNCDAFRMKRVKRDRILTVNLCQISIWCHLNQSSVCYRKNIVPSDIANVVEFYNNSLTVNSSSFDHEIVEGPNTYYINSLQLTRYQAQRACRARKMTLITIEEKQNVQRIIPKYYDLDYWTSNVTWKHCAAFRVKQVKRGRILTVDLNRIYSWCFSKANSICSRKNIVRSDIDNEIEYSNYDCDCDEL